MIFMFYPQGRCHTVTEITTPSCWFGSTPVTFPSYKIILCYFVFILKDATTYLYQLGIVSEAEGGPYFCVCKHGHYAFKLQISEKPLPS